MAERLNILSRLAIAGTLAATGIGEIKPAIASDTPDQNTTQATLVEPLRQESGKRFIDFRKGQSVLGDTVVIETVNGDKWKYNCFFPDAPRRGRAKWAVVDYSRTDLRAAKNKGAVKCENVIPRPGPRKETGDGSLPVGVKDFAYGYFLIDAEDGEVRYDVSVKPGDHPDGRIYFGVRNPRPGEAKKAGNFTSYDNANPRPGLRQETGAGGTLPFEVGSESYGYGITLNLPNGTIYDCNPQNPDGSRLHEGVKVINSEFTGTVESGVVDAPPSELGSQDFPICNPSS